MDTYTVNVNNRFALFLDDEDDPGDVVIPAPVKKEESTKSSKQQIIKGAKGKENKDKTSPQANKKPAENGNKTAERPGSNSKGSQRFGGGRDRGAGDNRRDRGDRDDTGRPPRGPRTGAGRPRLSSKEKDNDGGFGGGGGFGGSGFGDQGDRRDPRSPRERAPRPFRGGRGGGPRKREFERRSGNDKSSVKPFEKREGGGAHNWGKQEDTANEEWNNEEETPQESEPIVNGEATEETKTEETPEEESAPVEEEPQEMTLEEYRARNPTGRVMKAEVEERKAGENVDSTQWKNTFQLEKQDEEFFSGTREVIEKPKTSGRIKNTIDTTGFFFKDQARRGRGRTPGGPGGNRGGRRNEGEGSRGGRGERRSFGGGRKRDYAPNVEDEKDFPQLGAQ